MIGTAQTNDATLYANPGTNLNGTLRNGAANGSGVQLSNNNGFTGINADETNYKLGGNGVLLEIYEDDTAPAGV
jgi:hypothetical protein